MLLFAVCVYADMLLKPECLISRKSMQQSILSCQMYKDAAQLSWNDLSSASSSDNFSFLNKPQTYFCVQYKQSVILEN